MHERELEVQGMKIEWATARFRVPVGIENSGSLSRQRVPGRDRTRMARSHA